MQINKIHHISIICSDYKRSKAFYINILKFEVIKETYREERDSFKLNLALNGGYVIELFSFPDPPKRPSRPEALGLRHLAFEVNDLEKTIVYLNTAGVETELIRTDEITGKRFTFFNDPDQLPLEIYEA